MSTTSESNEESSHPGTGIHESIDCNIILVMTCLDVLIKVWNYLKFFITQITFYKVLIDFRLQILIFFLLICSFIHFCVCTHFSSSSSMLKCLWLSLNQKIGWLCPQWWSFEDFLILLSIRLLVKPELGTAQSLSHV